ncbi:hypothetical protein D3C81_2060920 [compost metagenome]
MGTIEIGHSHHTLHIVLCLGGLNALVVAQLIFVAFKRLFFLARADDLPLDAQQCVPYGHDFRIGFITAEHRFSRCQGALHSDFLAGAVVASQ